MGYAFYMQSDKILKLRYPKVIMIPKSNLNSKFGTPRRLRVWSRIANSDVT